MADNRPLILVSEPLSERALAYLRGRGRVRRVPADQLGRHIAEADALVVRTYTDVDEAILARATHLKVVGRAGVALDNIDVSACRRRGIQVVHTPAANTLAVVDYTIAMIIQLNRRFWPMAESLVGEEFHKVRVQAFGRFLSGLVLGIIGLGRIGSRVGRAAVALGMNVLYNDILDITPDYPATAVDKPALYARSDIVTLHVPLTDLTGGLICRETLSRFKDGAQLINSARGGCVVTEDLAEALRSGKLSGAAIDCHNPEPPPKDYPLFGLDNVILTPHIAARVPQAMENMCNVVHDVVAVLDGRTPQYPAPPPRGLGPEAK